MAWCPGRRGQLSLGLARRPEPRCGRHRPQPHDGVFDLHDAIAVAWTDSWDDNTPESCQGQNDLVEIGIADARCFDGMRNWNQVRPGVFDGGYAFSEYDLAHSCSIRDEARVLSTPPHKSRAFMTTFAAQNRNGSSPFAPRRTVAATLQAWPARRRLHRRGRHASGLQDAPRAPQERGLRRGMPARAGGYCARVRGSGAGGARPVSPSPRRTAAVGIQLNRARHDPKLDAAAPFAGEMRPVCDQKKVPLQAAQNAAADFFLVSDVPVAANVTGVILNDLANEFNPNNLNFGEKYAPPLAPVGFYDWTGEEVNRVYADQFGRYNAMVPSTWSANLPHALRDVAEHAARLHERRGSHPESHIQGRRPSSIPSSTRSSASSATRSSTCQARPPISIPRWWRSRPSPTRSPSRWTASSRSAPR